MISIRPLLCSLLWCASLGSTVVLGVVLGAVLGTGCVSSDATRCNDVLCPSGMSCSPGGDRCVDTDLVLACRSADNGATCSVAGLPRSTCLAGICQASRCGDGRVTGSEECDGNALDGKSCQTLGFYDKTGLRCTADCRYDTSQCVGRCGDGIKNGSELCDGKDLGKATCFTAGFYKEAGLACNADCTYDVKACSGGRCGDGLVNGLEQCDDKDLGGTTCKKLGFDFTLSGLSCSSSCTFTAKSCRCAAGERCSAKTQVCECTKFGCGCVAKR